MERRHPIFFTELPGTFFANLVCNFLDPGLRLSVRGTCKTLCTVVDTHSRPQCRLGGTNTLQDRFLVLSQVSHGIKELDVSCCEADLLPDLAEATLSTGSWQKLKRLVCHCKQMILVNTLVKQAPTQLASVSVTAGKGNWQHAGLLLQQLHGLPCLRALELALPAQHKLDEVIAGLTQIQSLKLTAAPRALQGGHWPLFPPVGTSNRSAKVDPAFWQAAICPLTQLTSLQLSLPLTGVSQMQLQPLSRLQQLQCCCSWSIFPDLLEQLTVLQALTSLCIDAKAGQRISPMALAQVNRASPDLQPLGNLTALVQLQLNLHQLVGVAALLPLQACKQLQLLAVSRLQLQLPWQHAELSPALTAAADAAEAALITAVMAGQRDVPVAQVLLASAVMARAMPATLEGMSTITLPLLPQLTELRVGFMAGKLPLAVLAPQISELCMMGRKRVWSHQRIHAAADDMEAFMDALGMAPPPAAPWLQAPGVAQQNFPAGQVVGVLQAAGGVQPNNGQLAGPQGAPPHQPAAAAGAAAGQQQHAAGPAAAGAAPAAAGQGAAGGGAAAVVAAAGGLDPAGAAAAAAGPFLGGMHGPPAAMRARAAAQAAEVMLGLSNLQTLDLNFTHLCGMCMAPGGRAVLDNIVDLTVLMRGTGTVPGGVPYLPRLKKLCFYDDYDVRVPGRPLFASYDQKEDHQLWRNQSVEELIISGSYILGGFFDSNALLKARTQLPKLRRWVFRDCMDLSAGHLAALLAIQVAPVVRVEGATLLTHSDVCALMALNPGNRVDLQWAAHIPPHVGSPTVGREYLMGGMGLDVMGPWDAPVPALIDDPFDPFVDLVIANEGQQGAAAGPGGGAAADGAGGPQQQQPQQQQGQQLGPGAMLPPPQQPPPPVALVQLQQQQQAADGPAGFGLGGVQVAFGVPGMFQMPAGAAVAGGGGAMAAIMQQLQVALAGAGMPNFAGAAGAGAGGGGVGGGVAQQLLQPAILGGPQNVGQHVADLGAQIPDMANEAQGAGGGGGAGAGAALAAWEEQVAADAGALFWQFDEADAMSDGSMSDEDAAEAGGWLLG